MGQPIAVPDSWRLNAGRLSGKICPHDSSRIYNLCRQPVRGPAASCVSNGNDTACHTSVRSALIHLRLRLQMSAEILEKCTTFEKLTNRAYQNMYNSCHKLPLAKCVGIALLQMHAPELSLKLNACLTSIKIYINYCLIY